MTRTVQLTRDPRAPERARAAIRELDGALERDRLHDAQLLASELVTNAVKYGSGGSIRVELELRRESLRVEVVDDGHGFEPQPRVAAVTDVGGWGLPLVEHLSDRWGAHAGSTHVWFEIRRRKTS